METEEIIKEATKELLLAKGHFEASLEEISKYAHVSRPIIYYYFKSRDKLIKIVLAEVLQQLTIAKYLRLSLNLPLKEKVSKYIDLTNSILHKYPYLAIYIMLYLKRNDAVQFLCIPLRDFIENITKQLYYAIEEGMLCYAHPTHFLYDLVTFTSYPYITTNFLSNTGVDNLNQLTLDLRKESIMNILFRLQNK
jgi:TetR/AcrR family transcriptional regulator